MRTRAFAAGAVLLVVSALAAKEPLLECGAYFTQAKEEAFLHMRSAARRGAVARAAGGDSSKAARANQDVGEIAVIGSGGGVVAVRNPFDLLSKTVAFTPQTGGVQVNISAEDYDSAAALAGERLALEDDDTQRITLPFPFRFYGATYTEAFVNSNGTVSFTAGDLDYSGSFGHFAAGPPAIAGLAADLNPPASTNGVRVFKDAAHVVVTWDNVPLATDRFTVGGQTFQIRLYASGKVETVYTAVGANVERTVVGLNPGALAPVELVDLSSATAAFTTGVAEAFTSATTPALDMMAAAQRFYRTHDDAYDYLVFYNSMGIAADSGVVAYELTTRSAGEGYGDFPTDTGVEYGSKRQLQAVLNLGPTSQYPADPFARVPARGVIGDTPVSILAHEAGHLHLALVSVPSPTGLTFPPMLGAGLAHWAFPFHSDASVMEGNRIEDLGPSANPRFRTTATVERYSELDQYLMGFREPREVAPMFAVLGSGFTNSRAPQTGIPFNGTRLNISINDVIAAAGRRTPDATVAQRHYRFAFVMVVPEEAALTAEMAAVAQIDAYRAAFEGFYAKAADFRGSIATTLRKGAALSLAPAGGVVLNQMATAVLEAPGPVTFALEAPAGVIGVPASVTVPAGSQRVEFAVRGNRVGVEELRATSAGYHPLLARVQVRPLTELRAVVVAGDKQDVGVGTRAITVRAGDFNRLGYAGQTLRVAVSGGGSVVPLMAVADAAGEARFMWTPTEGSFNRLTFTVEGGSGSAVATAVGAPGAQQVVNGASFIEGVAPGGFASIFGGSLAGGSTATAATANFPTALGGVRVTVNGVAAQLHYVSDEQINFVVPPATAPAAAQVVVESRLGQATLSVPIAAAAPGIFLVGGRGAVVVAGSTLLTQDRPGRPGEFLEIYCTGLGAFPSATVRIGGVEVPVVYAGPSSVAGLQQVNVQIPATLSAGAQDLVLMVGGTQANTVSVVVATGP